MNFRSLKVDMAVNNVPIGHRVPSAAPRPATAANANGPAGANTNGGGNQPIPSSTSPSQANAALNAGGLGARSGSPTLKASGASSNTLLLSSPVNDVLSPGCATLTGFSGRSAPFTGIGGGNHLRDSLADSGHSLQPPGQRTQSSGDVTPVGGGDNMNATAAYRSDADAFFGDDAQQPQLHRVTSDGDLKRQKSGSPSQLWGVLARQTRAGASATSPTRTTGNVNGSNTVDAVPAIDVLDLGTSAQKQQQQQTGGGRDGAPSPATPEDGSPRGGQQRKRSGSAALRAGRNGAPPASPRMPVTNSVAYQRLVEAYEVDFSQLIGEGAFGQVVKGHVRGGEQQPVAIKMLNKQRVGARNLMQCVGEVETMTLLNHEYIVRLMDVFQDEVNMFIVMEFLGGGSLAEFVLDYGALPESTVRRAALNLLMALEHIHDKGIVHRDLKPQNVLLASVDYRPPKDLTTAVTTRQIRNRSRSQIAASMRAPRSPQGTSPSESPRLPGAASSPAAQDYIPNAYGGGGAPPSALNTTITPSDSKQQQQRPPHPQAHATGAAGAAAAAGAVGAQDKALLGDPILLCKICDMGFAIMVGSGACLTNYCGTPAYMAPEVQVLSSSSSSAGDGAGAAGGSVVNRGAYGKPVDIWSLGVMLYYMACQKMPFSRSAYSEGSPEALQPSFAEPEWRHFSSEARDLLRQMLRFDPSKRVTAKQALTHPWIQSSLKLSEADAAQEALLEQLTDVAEREGDAAALRRLKAATKKSYRKCKTLRACAAVVLAAHRLVFYSSLKRLLREGCSRELLHAVNKGLMSFFLRAFYDPPSHAIRARKLLRRSASSPAAAINGGRGSTAASTSNAAAAAAADGGGGAAGASAAGTPTTRTVSPPPGFSAHACDFVCSLLEAAPRVTHFDVGDNGIESIDVVQRIVKAASAHKALVELSLAENPLHPLAGRTLIRFARNAPPSLTKLDVNGCVNLSHDIAPAINSAIRERAAQLKEQQQQSSSSAANGGMAQGRLGSAAPVRGDPKDTSYLDETVSSAASKVGGIRRPGSSAGGGGGAGSGTPTTTQPRSSQEWSIEYSLMRHLRAANPSRGIFAETISSAQRRSATNNSINLSLLPKLGDMRQHLASTTAGSGTTSLTPMPTTSGSSDRPPLASPNNISSSSASPLLAPGRAHTPAVGSSSSSALSPSFNLYGGTAGSGPASPTNASFRSAGVVAGNVTTSGSFNGSNSGGGGGATRYGGGAAPAAASAAASASPDHHALPPRSNVHLAPISTSSPVGGQPASSSPALAGASRAPPLGTPGSRLPASNLGGGRPMSNGTGGFSSPTAAAGTSNAAFPNARPSPLAGSQVLANVATSGGGGAPQPNTPAGGGRPGVLPPSQRLLMPTASRAAATRLGGRPGSSAMPRA